MWSAYVLKLVINGFSFRSDRLKLVEKLSVAIDKSLNTSNNKPHFYDLLLYSTTLWLWKNFFSDVLIISGQTFLRTMVQHGEFHCAAEFDTEFKQLRGCPGSSLVDACRDGWLLKILALVPRLFLSTIVTSGISFSLDIAWDCIIISHFTQYATTGSRMIANNFRSFSLILLLIITLYTLIYPYIYPLYTLIYRLFINTLIYILWSYLCYLYIQPYSYTLLSVMILISYSTSQLKSMYLWLGTFIHEWVIPYYYLHNNSS